MFAPRFAVATLLPVALAAASFVVQNDTFVKDGKAFNLRSGSLHYFRVPQPYWRDRMQRMKTMGLNSITMYVAWNYHEEVEGKIHGLSEVTGFLDAAKAEGMLVLFRPGPYICGEWELGGLPAWLLWNDKQGIKLRTYEPKYIAAATKWLNALYGAVSHYTYSKGGPIALVQIENEYGSFGNCKNNADDAKYMNHLLDMATSHFGTDVVYTTIDGGEGSSAADLEAGSPWKGDPRVLGTVDGGLASSSTYARAFERQKAFNAPGHSPKMWSELWVGWFTVWGDAHAANKSTSDFHNGVSAIVGEDASFSLYMAHGGTNFGFWSGANGDLKNSYKPDITSYDYSSPISEAGDHNIGSDGGDLFVAVQSAIASKYGKASAEPAPISKKAYGPIHLTSSAGLFDNLDHLSTCNRAVGDGDSLPSFEDLEHNYGLVLYKHAGTFASKSFTFTAENTHDRAQLFVDNKEIGTAYRPQCPTTLKVPGGSDAKLLVENMGRINYGQGIYDHKGYLGQPPIAGNWSAHCLPLTSEHVLGLPFGNTPAMGPSFQRGSFDIQGEPTDTWLDMLGFTKGYVWVNGHNLGRYWETAGPQHTLYLPAPFLARGSNDVIVLDLHLSPAGKYKHLTSVAKPRYYKPPHVGPCKWSAQTDQCYGLQQDSRSTTANACRDSCCADDTCKVWQYQDSEGCWKGETSQCTGGSTSWQGGRKQDADASSPANVIV